MRLQSQKSIPELIDLPYERYCIEVVGKDVIARKDRETMTLAIYSNEQKAKKAVKIMQTKFEELGNISKYRVFRFPEEIEL